VVTVLSLLGSTVTTLVSSTEIRKIKVSEAWLAGARRHVA
jgi:hypothetical protein